MPLFGLEAICDIKSLNRNVIKRVLFAAAFMFHKRQRIVLNPLHCFLTCMSCILMRTKVKWAFLAINTTFTYSTQLSFLLRSTFVA